MTIYHLAQTIEIKFWNVIIPIIEEEGPLMKTIHSIKRASRAKTGYIALLVFIWSAIGFVSGMIIGRVLWMLQFL